MFRLIQLDTQPIMTSYKLVKVEFNVWGLAYRVESYVQSVSCIKFSNNDIQRITRYKLED